MTTTNTTRVNSQSTVRKDKYGRRIYKNRISVAMADYREDFRYNREWWETKMGTGRNNEYLWIQYKNGDSMVIDSNYFEEHTALPRFRADEVDYISRFFGDGVEITTTANMEIDTDRIVLYCDGVEFFRMEMTAEQYKEMREAIDTAIDNAEDATKAMISFCMNLAQMTIEAEKRTAIESAKATAESITTTPETENTMSTTDTTDNAPACEETHAARCLSIYLNNTSEIYSRYTVPAIEYAAGLAAFGWEFVADALSNGAKDRGVKIVDEALKAAARLVRKHDHMTPTPADVELVKANYMAYIIECAQYEVNNA